MPSFPNDQSKAAGAIPVYIAGQHTGLNNQGGGTVNGSGTQKVIPAGTYTGFVTITNTDPANTLYIGFASGVSSADTPIAPGGSFTFPFGLANDLYGASSGSSTAFATIGW